MSSVGQAVGGIVGGVVGFFTPLGPVYGAQIGMMIGGVLDPPRTEGPRLEDLTAQTSIYGAFIPRLYGTTAVTGNVIWIQGDRLIEHSVESDGKGGPVVTNFEYFATFAVGLCEGQIDGVRRIWIGGQLWYDAGSDDLSTIIASNEVAATFTLYTGTDTKLADPLIQADRGAANVPAYRGLAYIVFEELPLKDYGNSLMGAQVKVEVVSSSSTSTLLLEEYSLDDATWHTTIKSVGNQNDEVGGFRNFVSFDLVTSSKIMWHRVLDQKIMSTQTLVDDSAFICFPANNALNRLQYAWSNGNKRAVWGRYGFIYYFDLGVGQLVGSIADGDGNAYILSYSGADGKRVTKVPQSPPLALFGVPYLATSYGYATHTLSTTALMCVWSGKAVVFDRQSASGSPLYVQVFDVTDGVLLLEDSYTIAVATPTFPVNTSNCTANIEGDTLTIMTSSGAVNVLVVNLSTKTIEKQWQITTGTIGDTLPVLGAASVRGNLIYWAERSLTDGVIFKTLYAEVVSSNTVQLSEIVESECLKSDLLTASDLDVTELTDQVRGYRISSLAPLRGGIDQLRKAWPFDAIQHGYKILFKKRGGASVATITEGELDARAAGANPGVRISNVREMDSIMPQQLTVQYMDATREYDVNVAEESR